MVCKQERLHFDLLVKMEAFLFTHKLMLCKQQSRVLFGALHPLSRNLSYKLNRTQSSAATGSEAVTGFLTTKYTS